MYDEPLSRRYTLHNVLFCTQLIHLILMLENAQSVWMTWRQVSVCEGEGCVCEGVCCVIYSDLYSYGTVTKLFSGDKIARLPCLCIYHIRYVWFVLRLNICQGVQVCVRGL